MDTRNKIVDWPEAENLLRQRGRSGSPLKVVTGYFDPLLAAHSRRLGEIAGAGGRLLVVLTSPDKPVLPARARAELVAALDVVEFVALPPRESVEGMLTAFPAASVLREEAADTRRTVELIRHVHLCRSREAVKEP